MVQKLDEETLFWNWYRFHCCYLNVSIALFIISLLSSQTTGELGASNERKVIKADYLHCFEQRNKILH